MGEDDERRSQSRTGLILHHQLVVLEPPVEFTIRVHLAEGVAENCDEKVDQQYVGYHKEHHEQNDHQPVVELTPAWLSNAIYQCHVGGAVLVQIFAIDCGKMWGERIVMFISLIINQGLLYLTLV